MSQLINVLQGTIVNIFTDTTFGADGREFNKKMIELYFAMNTDIRSNLKTWRFFYLRTSQCFMLAIESRTSTHF
jgi:hypothetical protein